MIKTMYAEAISDMLIFKTNVISVDDLQKLSLILDKDVRIETWNVDREDVDHVLRVKSDCLNCSNVISLVEHAGFTCEELTD